MKRSPRDTELSARAIRRRAFLLGGTALVTGAVLAGRMHKLGVDRAEDFRLLAEENRIRIRLLPPARGLIYDRTGVVLAENEQNFRVSMVREDAGSREAVGEVLERLSRLINIDTEALERAHEEILARAPHVKVTIADRLSWEDFSSVAVNAPALPGILPEEGLSRVYPLDADFAHVVGYVGPVSDYYLETTGDTDPVLQIPDFQVGRYGVERLREQELRGDAGTRWVEVNAYGREMRELDREAPSSGADLQLSVDAGVQNYAEVRLAGESASAVVIDVESGELVAMASAPAFDPNLFVRGISVADYSTLTEDIYRPLASKTVQGLYPPGSTYKMVTALAGLEAGLITPEETITCNGYTELGQRRFHCWRRGGHGRVDLATSLQQSCDVYYYELSQRVGIEGMSDMARRLGLGMRHDLPLSGVAEGLIPSREWKRANRGEDWLIGDSLNASIGQGFVLTTPVELAVMTARIASGRQILPSLVKSIDGISQTSEPAEPLDIAPENLDLVRRGMWEVVNTGRGTAYGSRVVDESIQIAGKTGTSQVRNITAAERAAGVTRNEDLPWERRDHALFVGYAPADAPRYAIAVVVEHGGGGSTAAAPIARDILMRALLDEVPPGEIYPVGQRRDIDEMHEEMEFRDFEALARRGAGRA